MLQQYVALELKNLQVDVKIAATKPKKKRQKRAFWQRTWIHRRPLYGQYEFLRNELREKDVSSFRNFVRVEPDMFQEVLYYHLVKGRF